MKQLQTDPWSDIDSHFRIGDVVTGAFTKITSFGAFVELKDRHRRPGAHLADSEERIEKDQGRAQPGQQSRPRTLKIDRMSAACSRSRAAKLLRGAARRRATAYEALNRTAGTDMMNLGDILDEASKKE